jgi:hypothetical protein
MTSDNGIMMSVQIAIIGIVVVVGLFVLWRRIARLEERVEALSNMQRLMGCGGVGGGGFGDEQHDDDEGIEDRIMANIFDMKAMCSMPIPVGIAEGPSVTVVEHEEREHEEREEREREHEEHIDEPAESVETGPSKSKIRKMNVEELKDLLEARDLPTDGNKAILVDRLIASMN